MTRMQEKPVQGPDREIQAGELLPWLLLWMAAPVPLWVALGMAWWMGR